MKYLISIFLLLPACAISCEEVDGIYRSFVSDVRVENSAESSCSGVDIIFKNLYSNGDFNLHGFHYKLVSETKEVLNVEPKMHEIERGYYVVSFCVNKVYFSESSFYFDYRKKGEGRFNESGGIFQSSNMHSHFETVPFWELINSVKEIEN